MLSRLNSGEWSTDTQCVDTEQRRRDASPGVLELGTVLVSPHGAVKVIRSRTAADDGWNCSDGAAVSDAEAGDAREWSAYSPSELAAALELAREVSELSGQPVVGGGLATWDACSGRPCILPKLAKLVR